MSIQEMYEQGLSLNKISELTGHRPLVILCEVDRLGLVRRTKSESAENGWAQRKFNKLKREQINESRNQH